MSKTRSLNSYAALFKEIKSRIVQAQMRAALSVNSELVRLYWDIGRMINLRQQTEGWGAAVIPRLARQLGHELPELKSFSERNIGRMIAFYRVYPEGSPISPPPVAKLAGGAGAAILPPVVAKLTGSAILPPVVAKLPGSLLWSIPWAHHVVLMEKIKDAAVRRWYMEQTLAHGWSRNILMLQIDAQAHKRHGKVVSNFAARLPAPQSDLVQQALKDPYVFDFLTMAEPFHERELETKLIEHVEKFLLELGQGFAFVGRQYRLDVGGEDFYIDLLFYHLDLRAFVVIDLKKGRFRPEYAGKLNFYCNVINDRLRRPTDQPTIGLILCQTRDRMLAEYSFAGMDKPIGVSTYELTRALPADLRSSLPTVEEIEAELDAAGSQQPSRAAAAPVERRARPAKVASRKTRRSARKKPKRRRRGK